LHERNHRDSPWHWRKMDRYVDVFAINVAVP
jgi:hypothetical protein